MLCWGKAFEGALGLGGIEESSVTTPTRNKHLAERPVSRVGECSGALLLVCWSGAPACGHAHTVLLLEDGSLLSCGNNEHGQLGHETSSMRPSETVPLPQ